MYYAYLHMLHFHHKWPNLKMYANCFKTKMTIKTAYTKIFFYIIPIIYADFFYYPLKKKVQMFIFLKNMPVDTKM